MTTHRLDYVSSTSWLLFSIKKGPFCETTIAAVGKAASQINVGLARVLQLQSAFLFEVIVSRSSWAFCDLVTRSLNPSSTVSAFIF